MSWEVIKIPTVMFGIFTADLTGPIPNCENMWNANKPLFIYLKCRKFHYLPEKNIKDGKNLFLNERYSSPSFIICEYKKIAQPQNEFIIVFCCFQSLLIFGNVLISDFWGCFSRLCWFFGNYILIFLSMSIFAVMILFFALCMYLR